MADEVDASFSSLFGSKKPEKSTAQQSENNVPSKLPVPVNPTVTGPHQHAVSYKMDHPRRGFAIIFNHITFRNGRSQRKGADVDEKSLVDQFEQLHFEVIVERDRNKNDIKKTLDWVAHQNHADADCLVIVVMTHGDGKELSAYDDTYKVSQLWESFLGQKSPSLIGKPKLFLIQACRGYGTDDGVTIKTRGVSVDSASSMPGLSYTIPSTADVLISYATYDGQFAWRHPQDGSWYIQSLCKELREHGETHDIHQIMTSVNRRVATEYESFNPDEPQMHRKKQMPNFLSTLTRQLVFSPKRKVMETAV